MNRTSLVIGVLTAALQLQPAAASAAGPVSSFARLPELLRPGDVVAITLWSEREHKGPLTELAGCSITVLSHGERVRFESADIQKIKRLARSGHAAYNTADAAKSCDGAPCTALSMVFAAGTSIGRALQSLSGPPTVYRAERSTPAATCSPAVANRAKRLELTGRPAARRE